MSKQPGGYPRQNPHSYPQQHHQQQQQQYPGVAPVPMHPYPQALYPQQHQGYVQPMHPSYGVPPPPYTQTPQQPSHYPIQQMPMGHQAVVRPVVQGSFDAGARFHQGQPPTIPPPPPGCPPTAAQVATAQGQSVVMGQNRSGWVSGGSDGGYTVW